MKSWPSATRRSRPKNLRMEDTVLGGSVRAEEIDEINQQPACKGLSQHSARTGNSYIGLCSLCMRRAKIGSMDNSSRANQVDRRLAVPRATACSM